MLGDVVMGNVQIAHLKTKLWEQFWQTGSPNSIYRRTALLQGSLVQTAFVVLWVGAPRCEEVGNQRFGARAASIFRIHVRGQDVSTVLLPPHCGILCVICGFLYCEHRRRGFILQHASNLQMEAAWPPETVSNNHTTRRNKKLDFCLIHRECLTSHSLSKY
jgi:hypothetical protein